MLAEAVDGKYIFLDVVGYTNGRSVEAQAHIVETMNRIVLSAVESIQIRTAQRLFFPAGDGVCIALLDVREPFDVHLLLAIDILKKLKQETSDQRDISRQFHFRVGINENLDNLITDINGNKNIAGAGINLAQRVMNAAGPGNIVVSQATYDRLGQREKYSQKFVAGWITIKHNQTIPAYLFHDAALDAVSAELPTEFVDHPEPQMDIDSAFFLTALGRYAEFIGKFATDRLSTDAVIILMAMTAQQMRHDFEKHQQPQFIQRLTDPDELSKAFAKMTQAPWEVLTTMSAIVQQRYLSKSVAFDALTGPHRLCLTPLGLQLLQKQWPEIISLANPPAQDPK